jgi:excisionase family DNA binding protein
VYLSHMPRPSNPGTFEPRFGRSVSLDQAACLLRVSRRTVYNWIRAGRLQTIRTLGGNSQRVLVTSLERAARPPEGTPRQSAGDRPTSFEMS